ncbi:uncharacterized protein LOC129919678 isoform X2 [Episyrphus balteatus]|uniref:uncharacterized protein LOC129919678 isoform X2 n=1 Tax=Episyrphus balteatus TaxID=286459 RepID=UPI0024867FB5|nr:uncharacterized protein LOC129919678 isoform X2 [Episyrphus balteatus]
MCGTYSITCPGVWLCTNGYMEATIKTLGYFFKTGAMEPKFPALCHDQFLMEGYFKSIKCISELEQVLAAESIEITLWQNGRRLAYYIGQLADVMHPPMPKISCFHNVNVQILMNTSQAFPGIIAPKLEISARAVIQDRKCSKDTCSMTGSSSHSVLIPNLQKSSAGKDTPHCNDEISKNLDHRRQQPVCHSKVYGSQVGKPTSGNTLLAASIGQTNDRCLSSKDSIFSRNESRLQSRRISSCSSSNTTNSYGISSESSLSKCSHSFSNPLDTEEHQRHCNICLSYKKAFDPLATTF